MSWFGGNEVKGLPREKIYLRRFNYLFVMKPSILLPITQALIEKTS